MNRLCVIIMILVAHKAIELGANGNQADAWTWLYAKKFAASEAQKKKSSLVFVKTDVPCFSQLIFSWNAFRPQKGHYSFAVQVRDAATKEWSSWHKMIEWGEQVQRSYTTKSDGWAQYFHVRLETGTQRLADSFCIKMEPHDGADLSLVRGCAVNVSDFTKFKSEVGSTTLGRLPSVVISDVPKKSQMVLDHPRSHELCSPTSTSMMAGYLCAAPIDPVDFAHKVFDSGLNAYGCWPFNTAHAFERCNGKVYFASVRFNSFAALHNQLSRNIPVVVSVRGVLDGAPKAYPKGHLLLVIGWDAVKKEVICHDPAFQADNGILARYPIDAFLSAWERSRRLAYSAESSRL